MRAAPQIEYSQVFPSKCLKPMEQTLRFSKCSNHWSGGNHLFLHHSFTKDLEQSSVPINQTVRDEIFFSHNQVFVQFPLQKSFQKQ